MKPEAKQKGLFIKESVECDKQPQGDFSINSVYVTPQEGTVPECDD